MIKKSHEPKDQIFLVENPSGLLEFLLSNIKNMSRNNIKSLLTNKAVFVENKACSKFDFPLKIGQTVTIKAKSKQLPIETPLDIIYEDLDFIVINKPAGLLSIATDKEKSMTAYHLLSDYVKQKDPKNRVFIVHRLDRDTSGVFLIAKNEKIKIELQDNWETLVRYRGYTAIVEGIPKEKSGTIISNLKETTAHVVYSTGKNTEGLNAITHYKVLRESATYALLDIHIDTGRKNQIRVHMKDIGHPIAGDKKYGGSVSPINRLGLHAHKLELIHPLTGNLIHFEAKAPGSFKKIFKT